MGSIGYGYGSECHLLRYLGRHRQLLNREIQRATDTELGDWLDFGFDPAKKRFPDAEPIGLEFLDPSHAARASWGTFWPNSRRQHNWDAVAITKNEGYLLIEAKAHVDELLSRCQAKGPSREIILRACQATKQSMNIAPERDWLEPYYQMANRLVALHHLRSHGIQAGLCLIYFTGDCFAGRTCPPTEKEWGPAIQAMNHHLGLAGRSELEHHVHKVFLPVSGPAPAKNFPQNARPVTS
jgi:hypothetical protein